MALSASTRADDQQVGQRARRIAEVLKQCFAIPPTRFVEWRRQALVTIFDARNAAMHPDADLRDPKPHPAVRAAVPSPAHVFRLENSTTEVATAAVARSSPRPRLGKQFRDGMAGWTGFVDALRQHRTSLGADVPGQGSAVP